MLCPDEGLLRAYADRELPARQADEISRHLAGCADCRTRLADVEKTARLVRARIALLAPGEADRPAEPALALAALRARSERRPALAERLRGRLAGFGQALSPARVAAAAVPVALAATLLLTPAGGFAQGMLGIFRAQDVKTVQIDASLVPSLPEPEDLGTFTFASKPGFKPATLGEASAQAQLPSGPRTVKTLPAGFDKDPLVMVSQPADGSFTYDIQKLKAYYQKRGLASQPPADLANLTFHGSVPSGVMLFYGDQQAMAQARQMEQANGKPGGKPEGKPGAAPKPSPESKATLSTFRFLVLGQVQSPKLEIQGSGDVEKVRKELLASGALPPEIAAQLAAFDDWQNTLPIPVLAGTSKDVRVDGNTHAVLVTQDGQRGLVWLKGGVLYGMFGNVSEADLLAAANSLGS